MKSLINLSIAVFLICVLLQESSAKTCCDRESLWSCKAHCSCNWYCCQCDCTCWSKGTIKAQVTEIERFNQIDSNKINDINLASRLRK